MLRQVSAKFGALAANASEEPSLQRHPEPAGGAYTSRHHGCQNGATSALRRDREGDVGVVKRRLQGRGGQGQEGQLQLDPVIGQLLAMEG